MSKLLIFQCCLFLQSVSGIGVCYDPMHLVEIHGTYTAELIAKDMEAIAKAGFSQVRTYASVYGENINVAELIASAGMQAVLGVPIGIDVAETHRQLRAAVKASTTGSVSTIFVGNENLANLNSVPSKMFDYIAFVRDNVPGSVKVGTVQRVTEFLNPNLDQSFANLMSKCDVMGVNMYPFFSDSTDSPKMILNAQWTAVQDKFDYSGEFISSESGWPSAGSSGGNVGNVENQQSFVSQYYEWLVEEGMEQSGFYFQMFDQPYKLSYAPTFEGAFGLFAASGESKGITLPFSSNALSTSTTASTAPAANMIPPLLFVLGFFFR